VKTHPDGRGGSACEFHSGKLVVKPVPAAAAPLKERKPMNDLIPLAQAHCLARRGSEHRLTEARVRELLPEVPGWELAEDGHALVRTYRFDDYYRTMAFVNALAFMAHREDHHPDLGVHYDRCVVRYSTHDVGGLSENDFICAAKADALIG
jgi:4a-hydroxytetrahydrobiopterin dehydratase